jgi:molecular chaperone DnaJ
MLNLDYYKILGVATRATQDEIKKAYRELVKKYHPDLHKNDLQAHKKMAEVNGAYDILSDPKKRNQYDLENNQVISTRFSPPKQKNNQNRGSSSWDFEEEDLREVFESFFEGFGKQQTKQQKRTGYYSYYDNSIDDFRRVKIEEEQGKDLTKKLTLTEQEALLGTKKEVKVKRYDKCVHCNGRGSIWGYDGAKKCPICHGTGATKENRSLIITLPAGLRTGMRVHVAGQGDAGKQGRKAGALYLFITVKVKAQKKGQDKRLTEVLSKIKELEKSYKKLEKKFTSKTFFKSTVKLIGPEWLELGKLYEAYITGKLKMKIEELKIKATKLKAFFSLGALEGLNTEIDEEKKFLQENLELLRKIKSSETGRIKS